MDSLLKARRRFILKYLSTLLRFATIVILVFQVASEPPSSKRFHLEEDCHIASSVLYSMMTKSLARCALLCHFQKDCVAYGYEPESGLCRTSSAFELLPGYCQCERPMLVGEDIYVSEEALSEYHKERVCKISEMLAHARPDSINCIQPDALTSRGEWGPDDWCPNGTYASGVTLRVEADQYLLGDDTALNTVRLICSMHCPGPTFCGIELVESSAGQWGNWAQHQSCPSNYYISGGRVRSEIYKEATDIVGATNYNFKCQSISDAAAGNRMGEAFGWGYWSSWESCPNGSYVCGLTTKVEPYQGPGVIFDDSALNDAIFYCCNFTHVW